MFSRMSIWMTMSRLFSGFIKLSAIDMFKFQFTYSSNDNYRKKLHRHFQGLWCRPGRTADLQGVATWVPNYQTVKLDRIFAPFGICHFILSPLPHKLSASETPLKSLTSFFLFSRQTNYSSRQNSNNFAQISSPAALGQRRWRAQGERRGLDKGDGGSIQVVEYKDTKEQK